MDIYVLEQIDVGGAWQKIDIVDVYVSFIWTDRYAAWGDFEIVVFNTKAMRETLAIDKFVWRHGARTIMQIETVETSTDDEGHSILTINGRSMVKILEDRPGMNIPSGTMTADGKWTITALPHTVVNTLFDTIEGQATFDIPLTDAADMVSGNRPFPTNVETFVFGPSDLYTHIKTVCDMYQMGFGYMKSDAFTYGTNEYFRFGPYMGNNRTLNQSTLEPVVFSLGLDSLKNIKLLNSKAGYKNIAYVFGQNGYTIVYADGVDPATVVGFNKRVLVVVDASITLAVGAPLTAALTQRGKLELAKYRPVLAVDGEIPQNSKYVFNVNYGLGDLVEVRDQDGIVNTMNVVEHIFVSDKEGERSYPTLALDQTVIPGTWDAYTADRVWDNATGTWLP